MTTRIDTELPPAQEEWKQDGTDPEGYPVYRLRLFDVQCYAIDYLQRVLADLSDRTGRPSSPR